MTPKHIVTIDLREIKAIEVGCRKCGSIISIPLPNLNLTNHVACVSCNTMLWYGEMEGSPYIKVLGILRSLSNWQAIEGAPFNLQFSLDSLGRASSETRN